MNSVELDNMIMSLYGAMVDVLHQSYPERELNKGKKVSWRLPAVKKKSEGKRDKTLIKHSKTGQESDWNRYLDCIRLFNRELQKRERGC